MSDERKEWLERAREQRMFDLMDRAVALIDGVRKLDFEIGPEGPTGKRSRDDGLRLTGEEGARTRRNCLAAIAALGEVVGMLEGAQ